MRDKFRQTATEFLALRRVTNPRIVKLAKSLRIMAWVNLSLAAFSIVLYHFGYPFTAWNYIQLGIQFVLVIFIFWWFRYV